MSEQMRVFPKLEIARAYVAQLKTDRANSCFDTRYVEDRGFVVTWTQRAESKDQKGLEDFL